MMIVQSLFISYVHILKPPSRPFHSLRLDPWNSSCPFPFVDWVGYLLLGRNYFELRFLARRESLAAGVVVWLFDSLLFLPLGIYSASEDINHPWCDLCGLSLFNSFSVFFSSSCSSIYFIGLPLHCGLLSFLPFFPSFLHDFPPPVSPCSSSASSLGFRRFFQPIHFLRSSFRFFFSACTFII